MEYYYPDRYARPSTSSAPAQDLYDYDSPTGYPSDRPQPPPLIHHYSEVSDVRDPISATYADDWPPPAPYSRSQGLGYELSPPNTGPTGVYLPTLNTALQPSSSLDYLSPIPETTSATTEDSSESEQWLAPSDPEKPSTSSSRKDRIALAADQPPTVQGQPRTRVYVACVQCRSRKIRCDGTKPSCHNCSKRTDNCNYDSTPKRRGPDKMPGARQRKAREPQLEFDQDNDLRARCRRRRRVDTQVQNHQAIASPPSEPGISPDTELGSTGMPTLASSSFTGLEYEDQRLQAQGSYPISSNGCFCHSAKPCPNTLLSPSARVWRLDS